MEGKKAQLKSKLLTYALGVQEKAGLLQWGPRMIDTPSLTPSQLFHTQVSLSGLSDEGCLIFLDLG